MSTAAAARKVVEEPVVTLVSPFVPVRGLAYSGTLHALIITAYVLIPWSFYAPQKIRVRNTQEILAEYKYEPLILPAVQSPGESGRDREQLQGKNGAPGKDSASDEPLSLPMPIYAGQQQIIVHSMNPVNSVQTIKRPDLVNPPKLKFPLNIKSALKLPAAAAMPVLKPAPIPAPAPSAIPIPQQEIPVPVQVATVENPVLQVRPIAGGYKAPQVDAPKVGAQAVDLKGVPTANAAVPVLRPHVETSMTPTYAVLNAVESPDAKAGIPNAEIEGSFAIVPKGTLAVMGSGNSISSGTGTGGPGHSPGAMGHGTGSGSAIGTGGSSNGIGLGGNGIGTGSGLGSGTASSGRGSGAMNAAAGNGIGGRGGHGNGGNGSNGSGSGTASSGTGTGATGLPGISIVGGTTSSMGGGATIPVPAAPSVAIQPRGIYGMTVVASGSNGGAARDLGVFGKTETVYTVYISMADAGGGPDCPLQYAIVRGEGVSASNAMLTPPYAVKKKPATVPAAAGNGRQVFIRGFIGADGKLLSPLAVGSRLDDVAKSAVAALQDWEFLPAQLEGQAVKVKVLIGVHVSAQ